MDVRGVLRRVTKRQLARPGCAIVSWPETDSFPGLKFESCVVDVPPDGRYVDAVGEAQSQRTLELAAGGRTIDGAKNRDHVAFLFPEPFNPYDPNAVRVFLSVGHVGYLSRADAVAYRLPIDILAARGQVLGCRASISGGWNRDGDLGYFGVSLYLSDPDALEQEIAQPIGAHSSGTQSGTAPSGWYPDPSGRHQHRYWDGSTWTAHVSTAGIASSSPLQPEIGTEVPDSA